MGDEVEIAKHKNAGKVGTVVKVDEESYIIRNISGDDIKVRRGMWLLSLSLRCSVIHVSMLHYIVYNQ